MTKQDLAIAKCSQSNKRESGISRLKYIYTTLAGAASLSVSLMSGCSSETHSENSALIADKTVVSDSDIAQEAKNIKDNITPNKPNSSENAAMIKSVWPSG